MATQLRKNAPFHCRTALGGRFTCLAVLAEDDGDFCKGCVERQREVAKKALAPIPRVDLGGAKHPDSCPAYWGPNPCHGGH
jgi:hypothetical protein